jgi:hypothetical protein
MSSELIDGINKILSLFYGKVLKHSTVPLHVFENNDDDVDGDDDDNNDNDNNNNNNNNYNYINKQSFSPLLSFVLSYHITDLSFLVFF